MSVNPVALAADPPLIALEGGQVTLAPLEQLAQRRTALAVETREAEAHAAQLLAQANSDARDAAAYLVAQRSEWDTAGYTSELSQIDSRTEQIDRLDAELEALDAVRRQGFTGFFKRFGDRQKRVGLIKMRDSLAAEVSATLSSLGMAVHAPTVPEADPLLERARQESAEADALKRQGAANSSAMQALDDEIGRRQQAIKHMGFDALWTAAWLTRNEPPAIDSPVTVHKDEVAWISVSAVLSREATQTRWTGSSQGVSFPIARTGIRYRVGAYRGHPIQTTVIKDVDAGSLVVTNRRIVFIGRLKSVTIALLNVVHVEAYTDALGVFQDRRETPDFFKLQTPQYVLFYINYALGRLNSGAVPSKA